MCNVLNLNKYFTSIDSLMCHHFVVIYNSKPTISFLSVNYNLYIYIYI